MLKSLMVLILKMYLLIVLYKMHEFNLLFCLLFLKSLTVQNLKKNRLLTYITLIKCDVFQHVKI
jgi:hypothetical protein